MTLLQNCSEEFVVCSVNLLSMHKETVAIQSHEISYQEMLTLKKCLAWPGHRSVILINVSMRGGQSVQ